MTRISWNLGAVYTHEQINAQLGGSIQSYLPQIGGRVVCGCFNPERRAPGATGQAPLACRQWDGPSEYANRVAPSDCTPRQLAAQAEWHARARFPLADASGARRYEVSGKRVLTQWFSYRKKNRERPIIGDRRPPSKLGDIQPDHWLAEYTTELLNVINVLALLVQMEPAQEKLLEAICAKPLLEFRPGTARK